jgi:amino acid transporter
MFDYVGFGLPSTAGEEMTDAQRDVPFAIFRSATLAVLLYGLPTLGILLVLPVQAITGLGGFTDAIRQAFTVYGGQVAADGSAAKHPSSPARTRPRSRARSASHSPRWCCSPACS